MLSVTALAILLGAEILVPQTQSYLNKRQAIKDVNAFAALLSVSRKVVGYRAPYRLPLLQNTPATPAQLEAIAAAARESDSAIALARASIENLEDGNSLVDGLNQAADELLELREQTNRALLVPSGQRDQAAIKGFLPGIAEVLSRIEPMLDRLENRVATSDASLTVLLNVARMAQDLRVSAARAWGPCRLLSRLGAL